MKEQTLKKLKKEVIKFLRRSDASVTEIASYLGRNHYAAIEVLNSLEEEKKIEKIEVGKRFTIYNLAE